MKYKNIELLEGSDAELFCNVEFENDNNDGEIVGNIGDKIQDLFRDFDKDIYIEPVLTDVIEVRCTDITLDRKGVELLKVIYEKLLESDIDAKISVGVTVDEEWFKREDGSEYNLDEVTFDEFLNNLEY